MSKPKEKKQKNLLENIEHNLFECISGKNYSPMNFEDLVKKLHIAPQHIDLVQKILKKLEKEKKITISDEIIYKFQKTVASFPETQGVISIHPRGFGFVTSKDLNSYPLDILYLNLI